MSRIVVAGAGHGGLTAAGLLAEKEHEVTVLERKEKGRLGHDWTDIFYLSAFEYAGIPLPPAALYSYKEDMTFINPAKTSRLKPHVPEDRREVKMERRDIYASLIDFALKRGVKILYGFNIAAPVIANGRITGVISTDKKTVDCDLLIDAAGLDSPVRKNLPESMGIMREVPAGGIFYAYRAFYNKKAGAVSDKYKVYFFHINKPGLAWMAAEEDFTDVLIGRFALPSKEDIEEALADLKRDNPALGDKLLRGGSVVPISVHRPIPVFTGNGYAAVGDSAGMTVPIIGSGIANSIRAGKMLADTVQSAADDYSAKTLWRYQKRYMDEIGAAHASLDAMKEFLSGTKAADLDFLFEKAVLKESDLLSASCGEELKIAFNDLLSRGVKGAARPDLLIGLSRVLLRCKKIKRIALSAPKDYGDGVKKWASKYGKA